MGEVRFAIARTNPDFDLVIERLYLCYDMKLVTFGIDSERNLIIQFPIFIQPYTQQPLILYQIEIVPIPIIYHSKQAHSFTHLQINKPYIALNSETFVTIRQQGLRTCKKVGYEFCCKELFRVKHKCKYICESALYFNLHSNTIKENCNFKFYYNKTDITPIVLDDGNEIILANWPNDKHIICNINNDIPIRIPSHLFVLVNRSVLCNCGIEADNNFFWVTSCMSTCELKISILL